MTARRRPDDAAPNLARLGDSERSAVLSKLLAAHPDLAAEADEVAARLLTAVDPGAVAVAESVTWELTNLDMDDLANRAGRHRGGYVEPGEAAWTLVEEAFDPFLADMRRLAELGHLDAATATARAVLNGLDRLGAPADDTILAWAGPDTVDHLAEEVRLAAKGLGLPISIDD